MELEKEIKQKQFENDVQKAVLNILFTSSWINGLITTRLKPFDISPQQYNVLRILRGSYPLPLMLADISSRMLDKMSNATRLVEKLRQKDLCIRDINANSRRQVDITITEKGLQMLSEVDEIIKKNELSEKLTADEAREISRLLDKLRS